MRKRNEGANSGSDFIQIRYTYSTTHLQRGHYVWNDLEFHQHVAIKL
jgi:hypothetical protein